MRAFFLHRNLLSRFIHSLKGWHYYRMAARRRRDLAEYLLGEETRIKVLLHRAAWHFSQKEALEQPAVHATETPALPASQKTSGQGLPASLNGNPRMTRPLNQNPLPGRS